MKREALYALVWSVPISKLAASFQLSDRGLAKHCAREQVPVPPRGHWAKLAAGKRVEQAPLPVRGPNGSEWTWIAPAGSEYGAEGREWLGRAVAGDGAGPVALQPPRVPELEFDMHVRAHDAMRRIAKLRVTRSELRTPHNAVGQLLEEDRQWWVRGTGPVLRGPEKRRRLALLSAVLRGVEMLGGSGKLSESAREIFVQFGGQQVTGRLHSQRRQSAAGDGSKEQLVFRVSGSRGWERSAFRDGRVMVLEGLIVPICCSLALAAEMEQRDRLMDDFRARLARFEDSLREAERERREARQAAHEHLRRQARAYREATDVRRYVAAVRERYGQDSAPFAAWVQWALNEADLLDPLARAEFDFSIPG